jgi:hypothetical protein
MTKWVSGVDSYWQTRVSTTGAEARSGTRPARYARIASIVAGSTSRSSESGSNGRP